MLPSIEADRAIVRHKQAGLPNSTIATKLGMSSAAVQKRWEELVALSKQIGCGYGDLTMQFNILCHQYQLLGESLKIIGDALGNRATVEEIRAILTKADPNQQVETLFSACIILRPFVPVDPEKSLAESTKAIQSGN